MKVGDYIRTHDGRIDKIVDIKNDFIYIENSDYGYRENYLKSSPNIIDLIEVGDYVNGIKVIQEYNPEGQYVLWIKLENEEFINLDNQEDIKSIVTKEQFEVIKYEVSNNE